MQVMNSGSQRRPMRGVLSSEAAASSVTSLTLSARMPTVVASPSISTSITTMRASRPASCVRHAEDQAQVRQRHDAAAHVDQPIDRVIGARHRGDRHRVEDLAHMPRLDGETLALQLEDQHNERMVVDACHGGHSAACLVSSCCWPCSTRCATSRISATVPSPRMVAPENAATSACSLDSDLMTVW